MAPKINGFTKDSFISYLTKTLIPDLKDSGRDATAEDFETAIAFMEQGPGGVSMTLQLDEQRIADLLCSGMEGGIGYWSVVTGYTAPKEMLFRMDPNTVYRHIDFAMNEGGAVNLKIAGGDDHKGKKNFKLTREKLLKGLQVMAEKYPRHYGDWLQKNDDAETGDVFIQCALFGEVVFR